MYLDIISNSIIDDLYFQDEMTAEMSAEDEKDVSKVTIFDRYFVKVNFPVIILDVLIS